MKSYASWVTLLYNLIHVLRRIALVLIAVYVHQAPWIQAMLFIITSELVCVYLVSVAPFESRGQNKLELVNECLILLTGYCAAISVGWALPSNHRFIVGVTTVILIAAVILFNVARWIVFIIKYAKMNYKRISNTRKRAFQVDDIEKASTPSKADLK